MKKYRKIDDGFFDKLDEIDSNLSNKHLIAENIVDKEEDKVIEALRGVGFFQFKRRSVLEQYRFNVAMLRFALPFKEFKNVMLNYISKWDDVYYIEEEYYFSVIENYENTNPSPDALKDNLIKVIERYREEADGYVDWELDKS